MLTKIVSSYQVVPYTGQAGLPASLATDLSSQLTSSNLQLIEELMDIPELAPVLIDNPSAQTCLAVKEIIGLRKGLAEDLVIINQELQSETLDHDRKLITGYKNLMDFLAETAIKAATLESLRDKHVAKIEQQGSADKQKIESAMLEEAYRSLQQRKNIAADREVAIAAIQADVEESQRETDIALKKLELEKDRLKAEEKVRIEQEVESEKAAFNKIMEDEYANLYEEHLLEVARIRAMERKVSSDPHKRNFEIDNMINEPLLKTDEDGYLYIVPAYYRMNMKGKPPPPPIVHHVHHGGGGRRGKCSVM